VSPAGRPNAAGAQEQKPGREPWDPSDDLLFREPAGQTVAVAVARAGLWVIRRLLTGEVDVAGRASGDCLIGYKTRYER
jgi:hypothetical protein